MISYVYNCIYVCMGTYIVCMCMYITHKCSQHCDYHSTSFHPCGISKTLTRSGPPKARSPILAMSCRAVR